MSPEELQVRETMIEYLARSGNSRYHKQSDEDYNFMCSQYTTKTTVELLEEYGDEKFSEGQEFMSGY